MKSDPAPVCPVSIPVSESTHFRVINHERSSEQCGLPMTPEETVVTVGMELQTEAAETQGAGGAAAPMTCDVEEAMAPPPGKMDSPSKRKGTISLHSTMLLLLEFCLSTRDH